MAIIDTSFFSKSNLKWLRDGTIFLTVHGSHCYGTNIETSDIDLKGIAIPPKEYFFGFNRRFEQAIFKDPDAVIFDIRKFLDLAKDANPNVIEILFTDPSDYIIVHPLMERILENKHLFITKKVRWTFSGYAISQLKRIKLHHCYLQHPPDHKPTRAEFDLPEHTLLPKDQLMAAEALIQKKMDCWNFDFEELPRDRRLELQENIHGVMMEIAGGSIYLDSEKLYKPAAAACGLDSNIIGLVAKEKRYKSKIREWQQYQEWKQKRNPVRASIEEKYGYDCKHALHLVRLIRMCAEILETSKVIVKRPDAEELVSIRNGAWKYDELIEWAEVQEKNLERLYAESVLPREPNVNRIDELCIEIVERHLAG